MKYIRTFESYRGVKKKLTSVNPEIFKQAINESVLQVGDLYKVRSMVDIPQSLINSYVKKEKDTTGRNLRQFFGDVEIAELLLQYITTAGLDLDKIPTGALTGQSQAQTQTQVQPGSQNTEEMPQAQTQPATQEVPQNTQETPQNAQETPQNTQEVPQSTQEVPQSTQETPQSTQETPQNTQETQFEEPQVQPQVQPQTQEEEEEEDENEELPA